VAATKTNVRLIFGRENPHSLVSETSPPNSIGSAGRPLKLFYVLLLLVWG
jgi:hypothetical protein